MALTQKENYLKVLNHEKPEFIPCAQIATLQVGFGGNGGMITFEKGPEGGGYDGFGVRWVCPPSGSGQPIPAPGEFILDSETVVDWKKLVKFPDIAHFDWEEAARVELALGDPNTQAVDFGSGNGPYERLGSLMGFEEALIAMACEPEATQELLDAITDFKIQTIEYVAKYYHADLFTNFDDIATERNLFMSPEMYCDMIKPCHKRINDAARAYGMIPIQHTCGKSDSVVKDMIETGAAAWQAVQPTNDIRAILEEYGDQFTIIGGYDTNGKPGRSDATEEEVREEVRRCFRDYSDLPGYIFFGFFIVNSLDPHAMYRAMAPLVDEAAKCSGIELPVNSIANI